MPALIMNTRDELISAIKEKIMNISGRDAGRPVNLENVLLYESDRTNCGGKLYITCMFINEDGNVYADMCRSGTGGCVDFFCGLGLNSISEKNLKRIMSALDGNMWSVAASPVLEKQKKRNPVFSIRLPFLQKGA